MCDRQFFTTGTIAKMFGCSRKKVCDLISSGVIAAHRFSSNPIAHRRVAREELLRYMRANRIPISPEMGE